MARREARRVADRPEITPLRVLAVAPTAAVIPGAQHSSSKGGAGFPRAESQVISSVAAGGSSFDIGAFLGAGRYYSNGVTGQGTKTANLEAGHIWNGHETLQHVTNYLASSSTWSNGTTAALYDRHATWVGMVIGGRQTTNGTVKQQGIAYGTDLLSRAIATSWSSPAYALSFGVSTATYRAAFTNSFAQADVINSSYGFSDPSGSNVLTMFSDAIAAANRTKTYVVSAGNSGSGTNTVGSPGAGYNAITVGALGSANSYNSVASFSSRAPQDFLTYTGSTTNTASVIAGARAAVDISAPGTSIQSAYFGGQSGGNNSTLTGSTGWATNATTYSTVDGTSFSAPLVAGGVALMASAAKSLPTLSNNTEARQSVVLKSVLLTAADKTSGWSNGQGTTNGVITTSQSLDWAVGAGRMNLDRTFDLQVNGQTGVTGTNTGNLGAVFASGWDYGAAQRGATNEYTFDGRLLGGSTFTTTLSWLRERTYSLAGGSSFTARDQAQADLNLSLWQLGVDNSFENLVAESVSLYNVVEHLSFALPASGYYGLRVTYAANTFDLTAGQTWGTGSNLQTYGVAWSGTSLAGDQVAFQMQTNNLNAVRLERNSLPPYTGVINNGTNEVQLYANGGGFGNTPGAAGFQTFTTSGDGNTGTARPLQPGDTFTITAFTGANASAGGRMGISFRDSTDYTDFFSSTDAATEMRLQLDNSGNWKIYEGDTERMSSGSGPGADRTLVVKITSSTTFDAQIGGTWYYNFSMGAGGGLIDSLALYSYGDSNPDIYWKNGLLEDSGTVELGYALGSANSRSYAGNVFTPGEITDGLAATSNVTVRTNSVFVGGDAGSQVNLVNSNTFTGGLTINANATLEAQHAHALGATNTGSTVSSGGTLKLYSIAGISFAHEALLLYGTGVGATNGALRNVGGNNVWNGAITLGSSVRINADTTGGAGSLTLAGSVDGGNNTLYVGAAGGTNGGNVTIAGTIGGGGGLDSGVVTSLYKDGAGTLTLSGANNFTGATRIATGTLSLSATGGNAALGSTAAVRVDTGATLLLSASSQLSDAASITLSGGTIARAGGVDEVFGNLNLTTSSFLDYGSGEAGSLRFGTYSPSALLTVQNFFAGNKLQFASTLSGAQLADPSLFSFSNSFTTGTEGGFFTITAIPEPSASFAAAALLAMMLWSMRRSRKERLARV